MNENIINLIIAILSGLAASIPLAVKLVEYVQKAMKEKNWSTVLAIVMDQMKVAETMYGSGEGDKKKEYVLAAIDSLSGAVDYEIDKEAISKLIDSLVEVTKNINVGK